MTRLRLPLLAILTFCLALPSCVYVTKKEFESFWDSDGDGWPLDQDCDDNDADVYPYAPDRRGDNCDADCGMEPDSDGDDWPDQADCAPENAFIFPCANDLPNDGIDSDCNGFDGVRTDTCPGDDPDFPDAPTLSCGGGG